VLSGLRRGSLEVELHNIMLDNNASLTLVAAQHQAVVFFRLAIEDIIMDLKELAIDLIYDPSTHR
jgi:hypothetical protein